MLSVHVHLQMFAIAKVRFIFGHILYCTRDNQYYKSVGFMPMMGGEGAVQKRVFLVC